MVAKTSNEPLLKDGEFTVEEVRELNFFDLTGKKSATKGSSNKSYHAELCISKTDDRAHIFTMFGPTGGNQSKDWRHYDSKEKARKEFAQIIKSKLKKGYKEIDVAQRAYGTEEAKQITKAVVLKNAEEIIPQTPKSSLHPETQRLMTTLFGATNDFVIQTLKCPLGQLTNAQIDSGRACLNEAKDIINRYTGKAIPNRGKDYDRLHELTNDFYGLIPHNLGSGARGQMVHLLLDDLNKVVQKEQDLDTLLDAKSVGAVLKTGSSVDSQYQTLNAEFTYIDHSDDRFKFIENYFHRSANSRHGFGNVKVKNVWALDRKDGEIDFFTKNADKIASQCGNHTFEKEARLLAKNPEQWGPAKRIDLSKHLLNTFIKANVWLCWHGTRSPNVVGITKRGLLIRPVGAVHTGSMFGDGKYFAWQSSKSLQYCDGGYWTGGRNSSSITRYMFLLDVIMGNMHVAPYSNFYRCPPKGFHSVYGKANVSGVMNDEMITYDFEPKDTQSRIRYLLEIV